MSVVLPSEIDYRSQLRKLFEIADETLQVAVSAFGSDDRFTCRNTGGIDRWMLHVGLTLLSKACKLHRSVIRLAEIGLAEEAEIEHRSLFETSCCIEFVLRRTFRVTDQRGDRKKGIPDELFRLVHDDRAPFNGRVRARLVIAHAYLQHERLEKEFSGARGLRRSFTGRDKAAIATQVSEAGKLLGDRFGPRWIKLLRKTKTYHCFAGLKNLTEALGPEFRKRYSMTYGPQSWSVHATDVLLHMHYESDGALSLFKSDPQRVIRVLAGATISMLIAIRQVDRRFDIGLIERVDDLTDRLASTHQRLRTDRLR